MNNTVATAIAQPFYAANAGAYTTTGTALTTVATGVSNREQENTIGSRIDYIRFDILLEPGTGVSGNLEYAVFKAERQSAVPALGTGLPTSAEVTTLGLQAAMRQYQPDRS